MSDDLIAQRVRARFAAKRSEGEKPAKNPGELVRAINTMVKKVSDADAATQVVRDLFKKYPVEDHDADFQRGKEAEAMVKLLCTAFKKFEDSPLVWEMYVEHPMGRIVK